MDITGDYSRYVPDVTRVFTGACSAHRWVQNTSTGADAHTCTRAACSANQNAYVERFVLAIKSECLSKLVPLGERHLRVAVTEFVEHYDRERNHQGVDNQLLMPAPPANDNAPIARRERLGGLLSFYYRRAA